MLLWWAQLPCALGALSSSYRAQLPTDLLLLLFWALAMTKLLEIRNVASVLNFFLLGIFF